jgi:sigma-B regulation protein RsbU (phosphoserine phosphatase)
MRFISLELESKLREKGLWPGSWAARAGLYVLALDILLFALQLIAGAFSPRAAANLGGWVTFLTSLAAALFGIVGFRWLRGQLLWRLRNRLIVTYVFIGVIPVFLLVAISLITLYLLAGQFASFVVKSEIDSHLRSTAASSRTIAHLLETQLSTEKSINAEGINGLRPKHREWSRRQVCVWYGEAPVQCAGPPGVAALDSPGFELKDGFQEIVRDHEKLYLRTASVIAGPKPLRVASSEPLDRVLMEEMAAQLGEITLIEQVKTGQPSQSQESSGIASERRGTNKQAIVGADGSVSYDHRQLQQTFTAGAVPGAQGVLDHEITFGTPLSIVEWASNGERQRAGALVRVQTRPSVLYARLFAALGDFAQGIEYILLFIAIVFAVIELLALFVGSKLTRSITAAVAQLYNATKHINRGDFSHRIQVKSNDQLATLANSFNSMTASIEKLIQEQKEKQRMENELAIAQEVQAQLFPKEISQLESLEVHGFCRPARTVSGDYYDFLSLNSDKLILAVGDISGKGISAALLMATIHSAVRAYSLEGVPLLREPAAVGAVAGSGVMLATDLRGAEASPATLLSLLNHQLYRSTPQEKYATLFLGIYDGSNRQLTYANGGHLPPIVLGQDGSLTRLDCGGTVVGLFDSLEFPETTVQLRRGDILVAYSDGVTEPENDYGEFGEERLLQIVRENRDLPLTRVTELVTAAVDDWIGDNEQPDDVTLVLARAK